MEEKALQQQQQHAVSAMPEPSAKRMVYGATGIGAVEQDRAWGARAYLSRFRARVSLASLLFAGVAACAAYAASLERVALYADDDHNFTRRVGWSLLTHMWRRDKKPDNLAVVRNRWTGEETVYRGKPNAGSDRRVPEVFYISRLTNELVVYRHPLPQRAVIDLTKELAPERFVTRKGVAQRLGVKRAEADNALVRNSSDKKENKTTAKQLPSSPSSPCNRRIVINYTTRSQSHSNVTDLADVAMNNALSEVVKDEFARRYRAAVVKRAGERVPLDCPAYADELLATGVVDGSGMTVQDVVVDLDEFGRTVFETFRSNKGKDYYSTLVSVGVVAV